MAQEGLCIFSNHNKMVDLGIRGPRSVPIAPTQEKWEAHVCSRVHACPDMHMYEKVPGVLFCLYHAPEVLEAHINQYI